MKAEGDEAVYAAQFLHYLRRIQEQWKKDAARINERSKECNCFRRTYGLDGHVQILIHELVRLAEEQLDEFGGDIRVRAWSELQRENHRLKSRIKSLRDAAAYLVEIVDAGEE